MKTIVSLFLATDAIKPACIFFLIFFSILHNGYGQENLLRRKVSLTSEKKPLGNVLLEISDEAQFTFSYDASILASNQQVSVNAKNASVKSTLDQILPRDIDYKVTGNHLILLKKPAEKPSGNEKFSVSGTIRSAANQKPLSNVVIFEISSLVSAVTDESGSFVLTVPAEFEQIGISLNKVGYKDSIFFLAPQDQKINVALTPQVELMPAEKIQNLSINQSASIESVPFVQQIVPQQSRVRTKNLDRVRGKTAQISFLPMVGTNLKMSGLIENDLSLNVLIGYSYGVGALEVGGLFNIVRKNVSGVQAGGLGNFVGGNTNGVQLGGLFNHNRGSFDGVQVAGVNNMIVDTLTGVQISGVNNILNGGMKGWQIAGVNNLTTRNVDGVQIAGLTNLTAEDVKMLQIAGLINFCENVRGMQLAGLVNVAKKDVKGFQLAGVANWGKNVKAAQFAGVANFSSDTVSGAQISGVLNYARYTKSSQLGFINIADSASGIPIGFFSFVKKGFHTPEFSTNEIFPVNVAFKTGVNRFYNIFAAGYGSWTGQKRWTFGYGIGSEKRLTNKTFFAFEFMSNWINEGDSFQEDLSTLNRLNFDIGFRLHNKFSISAGPSINVLLTEWKDPETGEFLSELAPYKIGEKEWGTTMTQVWVGGRIALHW